MQKNNIISSITSAAAVVVTEEARKKNIFKGNLKTKNMFQATQIDVRAELEKNKDITENDVQKLRDWIAQQPHLPQLTDCELILFLNATYSDHERARKCVEIFYTFRSNSPEIFEQKDINLKGIQTAMNASLLCLLPGVTSAGYRMAYCRLMDTDPDKFVIMDQIKLVVMMSLLTYFQNGTADGYVIVVDMDGAKTGHFLKVFGLNLTLVRKLLFIAQEAVPIRIKSVHVINGPPLTDKLFAFVKPFLQKSLVNTINFHPKPGEKLYREVPQKSMPNEYGGEGGTLQEMHEFMVRNMIENAEYFRQEELERQIDESKRPEKSKINDLHLFGIHGSFRTLEID